MVKLPKPSEWTDEELAAVLLSQLGRIFDAGGISGGRSRESALLDAAQEVLRLDLPLGGQVGERPVDEILLREVTRRISARFQHVVK